MHISQVKAKLLADQYSTDKLDLLSKSIDLLKKGALGKFDGHQLYCQNAVLLGLTITASNDGYIRFWNTLDMDASKHWTRCNETPPLQCRYRYG